LKLGHKKFGRAIFHVQNCPMCQLGSRYVGLQEWVYYIKDNYPKSKVRFEHDQGEKGEAFLMLYEVQRKECIVRSSEKTRDVFEYEEVEHVDYMELANIGFVKIERALNKYGINAGRDELTDEEREELHIADMMQAAKYLQ